MEFLNVRFQALEVGCIGASTLYVREIEKILLGAKINGATYLNYIHDTHDTPKYGL